MIKNKFWPELIKILAGRCLDVVQSKLNRNKKDRPQNN
jgi:hypothetical protein